MKSSIRIHAKILTAALSVGMTFAAHAVSSREAEALSKATVSLAKATEIAEEKGQGKTVSAEFDIEKNRSVWEVKVLGDSGVMEYKIDASTGAVVKVEDEHIRGRLTNFVTGMNLQDLNSTKTSLVQAVTAAENKLHGKAVMVEVEHEHDRIQYDIFVRAADKTEKVKIEADTGQPQ